MDQGQRRVSKRLQRDGSPKSSEFTSLGTWLSIFQLPVLKSVDGRSARGPGGLSSGSGTGGVLWRGESEPLSQYRVRGGLAARQRLAPLPLRPPEDANQLPGF